MQRAIALVLVLVAGCGTNVGTNVAGGVTLAAARATCIAEDTFIDRELLESTILVAESVRDTGGTEFQFLFNFADSCDNLSTEARRGGCLSCFTQIAAAVWN